MSSRDFTFDLMVKVFDDVTVIGVACGSGENEVMADWPRNASGSLRPIEPNTLDTLLAAGADVTAYEFP